MLSEENGPCNDRKNDGDKPIKEFQRPHVTRQCCVASVFRLTNSLAPIPMHGSGPNSHPAPGVLRGRMAPTLVVFGGRVRDSEIHIGSTSDQHLNI